MGQATSKSLDGLILLSVIEVPRDLGSECIPINLKNQSTVQYVGKAGRNAQLED